MDTNKTKVIFRRFHNGDIIALFPELPGTMDPGTCLSYEHTGQHGAASISLVEVYPLATPAEYRDLQSELAGLGYNLHIMKRFNRAHLATRRASLNF